VHQQRVADAHRDRHARQAPRHVAAGKEGRRALPAHRKFGENFGVPTFSEKQVWECLVIVIAAWRPPGPRIWRNIAEISVDIHELVVAEENVHVTARSSGLRFEREKQVDTASLGITAIKYITKLHQVCGTTGPSLVLITNTGNLQASPQSVEIAVYIANGHYSVCTGKMRLHFNLFFVILWWLQAH
jgi:hypothetical protein